MSSPSSYRRLRHRILAAIAVAAVIEACDGDVSGPTEACLELDDADDPCPPAEDAAAELDEAIIEGTPTRWPERTYRDGDVTYTIPAECCYELPPSSGDNAFSGCSNGFGRPFIVGGSSVVARAERRESSWIGRGRKRPRTDHLDIRTRHTLGKAWLERGLSEHAAVASFARFTLELMALGAPADLVREASRAGMEEVQHAELCFAIAEAYRGECWGPGALDGLQAPSMAPDVASFAARVALEGCIHETIGVAELDARAELATDPVIAQAYRRLVAEETGHAAIGWRSLAWICQRDPRARSAAGAVFRAFASTLAPPSSPEATPHPLSEHGELSASVERYVTRAAFFDVIVPAARRACGGGWTRPVEASGSAA